MNTKTLLLAAAFGLTAANSWAQISIMNFNDTYTENFDSYLGTQVSIPTGYTFSDTDYSPGGLYDIANTYANSNSNYGLLDSNVSATDIAFGQKGPTSGTDFLNLAMVNNTGSEISEFTVTWDFEQYSSAGRATELNFNYNPNSSGFTTIGITGSFTSAATTGSPDGNLSSVAIENKSVSILLDNPLQDGEGIIFGWGFRAGAGSGSNGHIGVDNITVTAIPEPSVAAMLLIGMGFLFRFMRKKK